MRHLKTSRWCLLAKRLWLVGLVPVLASLGLGLLVVSAVPSASQSLAAWSNPSAMALQRVSQVNAAQNQPNNLPNLDCSLVTYRLVGTNTMQTGCFTPTAFGEMDGDSEIVIFNGGDEGVPLLAYGPHDVLAPWPKALDLVTLSAANQGGSYISLYKNPLGVTNDQHAITGQLSAKQLTQPPDLPLRDQNGQQLVVNPATIAFSGSGSWLVAETLVGSFLRINLATLDETAFAPAFGSLGSPALLKSQVSVSDDGRYVSIENTAAASFKVYDLSTCTGNSSNWQANQCQFYDYWSFVRQQLAGIQSIRHVRFVNENLISFEASMADASKDGIYELAPTDSIVSLTNYIGLGDSYTSGEGAFDYLAGTDTVDDMCHLSANSYPLLLTRDLFGSAGGHAVACSGAVIDDVASTSEDYRGQVRAVPSWRQLQQAPTTLLNSIEANYLPGYIAQQRFVRLYQPGLLTVSVGGDDIGFGAIVQRCVEPHISQHASDDTCFATYEDRQEVMSLIDKTKARLSTLYAQLLAEAPRTRLYVVGYPQIAVDTGNCALNVHLGKSEVEFAVEIIKYLNDAVRQAATTANVTYVDISQSLAGHRLCEVASYDVAVNGLTAGKDAGPFGLKILGKESYHPNALGQQLIEQAILKQTHDFRDAPPTASSPIPSVDSASVLANAPKSGRLIRTLLPDDKLTNNSIVDRGGSLQINVNGLATGLLPNSAYVIRIDGSDNPVITTLSSDSNGDLLALVTMPISLDPGGHTIDVTGQNQQGDTVDITKPIYLTGSPSDTDGDGIPDSTDSCPTGANSGKDDDSDGIDDACDAFIGPAVAPPFSPSPNQPAAGITVPPDPPANTGTTAPSATVFTSSSGAISPLPVDIQADQQIASTIQGQTGVIVSNDGVVSYFSRPGALHSANPLPEMTTSTPIQGAGLVASLKLPHRTNPQAQELYRASTFGALPRIINWLPWTGLFVVSLLVLFCLGFWINRVLAHADGWRVLGT